VLTAVFSAIILEGLLVASSGFMSDEWDGIVQASRRVNRVLGSEADSLHRHECSPSSRPRWVSSCWAPQPTVRAWGSLYACVALCGYRASHFLPRRRLESVRETVRQCGFVMEPTMHCAGGRRCLSPVLVQAHQLALLARRGCCERTFLHCNATHPADTSRRGTRSPGDRCQSP